MKRRTRELATVQKVAAELDCTNSHFAEVALDKSHKDYIELGLGGDEGRDFTI